MGASGADVVNGSVHRNIDVGVETVRRGDQVSEDRIIDRSIIP
jgi:hypothetical protein